jgi:hypothetical protein
MPSTSKCNWPNQSISEAFAVLQPFVSQPRYSHHPRHKIAHLPGHLVGLVTLPQAERAGEVRGQHIDLLDVGKQSLVDGLLVGGAAAVDLLLL